MFNTTGVPDGFSFILAIDWFVDRLRTTVNVTGDAVVSGMVAHLCPIDDETADIMPAMETSDDDVAPPEMAKSVETPPEDASEDEF